MGRSRGKDMTQRVHVYVAIEQDSDGYPPYSVEELDATPQNGDRYRIESIPVFVYGMSKYDVVQVVRVKDDSRLWVERTAEPSGHWTVRVLPVAPDGLEEVAAQFVKLGCHSHATPFGLVAVDVPPGVPVSAIMERLEEGRSARKWDFDIGVMPP